MTEWLASVVESLGYLGIGLLMFLEIVFPLIPSEVVMPAAGFGARQGDRALWAVILAGSMGSLLGSAVWYLIGVWIGGDRVKAWADRWGKWCGVSASDVERADAWFHRHGNWAVLFGRLVPGIRTLISVPAGIARMPFGQFLFYTAIGTLLWTGLLTWLGWMMGDQYELIAKYFGWISLAVLGILFAWLVIWFLRRRQAKRTPAPPGEPTAES